MAASIKKEKLGQPRNIYSSHPHISYAYLPKYLYTCCNYMKLTM